MFTSRHLDLYSVQCTVYSVGIFKDAITFYTVPEPDNIQWFGTSDLDQAK